MLPSTYLLVRLDQRFAIDPCSPSLRHFAMQKVTSLEPRTPHQPDKLQKLSKNEIVFTPFIFRINKKPALLSAAKSMECMPSTAGCHNRCAGYRETGTVFLIASGFFRVLLQRREPSAVSPRYSSTVKIKVGILLEAQFSLSRGRTCERLLRSLSALWLEAFDRKDRQRRTELLIG